jgi:hypothetical protein
MLLVGDALQRWKPEHGIDTSNQEVCVVATQEKWLKLKAILLWLWEHHTDPNGIDHHLLEKKRGFTFFSASQKKQQVTGHAAVLGTRSSTSRPNPGVLKPGPKGVENPVSMFLDPEDPLSWEEKFGNFNLSRFGEDGTTQPPSMVRPVKRLRADIKAMMELTESEDAPRRPVRPGKVANAIYGFGDASKDGFGVSIEIQVKGIVMWRSGTWSQTMREESSNYQEFCNLVETVKSLARKGALQGHELFTFTDNSTSESAFFKGTSSYEKLFDLVLRLWKIEMEGNLFIHLIHVAGTRMIWTGVDGLSCGDRNAGVMAGGSMRSASLLPWIESWAAPPRRKGKLMKLLSPTKWCDPHLSGGTYVWLPPPAAAAAAIEWLGQSIHKRPDCLRSCHGCSMIDDGALEKKTGKNIRLTFHCSLGVLDMAV